MELELKRPSNRAELMKELEARYCNSSFFLNNLIYLRKRYAWIIVVGSSRIIKRLLDVILSAFLTILLSPVMLLIAFAIKLSDGGPVLYVTPRVGRYGQEFSFPKFRSMKINANKTKVDLLKKNQHKEGVTFKIRNDPRITRVGKWIRKTSLDELPQLLSVFIGHMSLVGPRPPLPEEVEKYSLRDRRRLDTKPGITCIWQVTGRSEIPFSKQVSLDLEYIESQSFWLDFKLLLKTIPAVFLGKGAY